MTSTPNLDDTLRRRLLTRIRKKKYRETEKGREQRRQESRRYYARKKAAKAFVKEQTLDSATSGMNESASEKTLQCEASRYNRQRL